MSRIGLLLSVVAILAACTAGTVDASGNLVAEARPVEGFTRIEATTGVSVRLIVDPSNDAAVVVHYDDNLVDDVTTVVSGDTLRVGIDGSVSIPGDGERFVAVTVPSLTGVDVSNGANLVGTGSGPALEVTASTGANVDLHGFLAGAVILDASGGGQRHHHRHLVGRRGSVRRRERSHPGRPHGERGDQRRREPVAGIAGGTGQTPSQTASSSPASSSGPRSCHTSQ
jgi:hypothetical protein